MFGKNPLRKLDHREDGVLSLHSMFYTIQGEGPFAGQPAVFVRLSGCSLACSFCDTEFENQWTMIPPDDLAVLARRVSTVANLLVITGGEPMRQNISPFVRAAQRMFEAIQIETAGIHCPPDLPGFPHLSTEVPLMRSEDPAVPGEVSIVVSPKTGKLHPFIEENYMALKYIIGADDLLDPRNGLPCRAVSQRGEPPTGSLYHPHPGDSRPVFVQPRDDQDAARTRANHERCVHLAMRFGYFVSLQQHKLLNLP